MKRSIFAILVLLGALVISIASPLIYDHYVDDTPCVFNRDAKDSVSVNIALAQVLNPVFYTIQDVAQHQEEAKDDRHVDSIFVNIPKQTLYNISKVLIGRTGSVTKRAIVYEYQANYDKTYRYLDTKEKVPLNVGDTIRLPSYTKEDTIINGKHFKLVKNTENDKR